MKKSLYFVLNAKAAVNQLVRETIESLRSDGHRVEARALWEPGHATAFAAEAAQKGFDVVVAAGGDGTLNEVINGILSLGESSTGAAVVPFGTANDFANGCGVPVNDPALAIRLVADREPSLIDIGRVNDRFFVNVASGGVGAEVTAETSPVLKALLGGVAYSLTGMVKAFDDASKQASVRGLDFVWEGKLLLLAVANGRLAGGGYVVGPSALLDDQLLDVAIVPEVSLMEIPAAIDELTGKVEGEMQYVKRIQTPWLDVETSGGLHVNVDGEPLFEHQYHFEIHDKKLPFVVPSVAPLAKHQ